MSVFSRESDKAAAPNWGTLGAKRCPTTLQGSPSPRVDLLGWAAISRRECGLATALGIMLGIVAILLAWIWARGVPSVTWREATHGADRFIITNNGPGDAVVTRAIASNAGDEVPAGTAPEGVLVLDERLGGWSDPYCRGALMPVGRELVVMVGVNCHLQLTYRASGRLSRLSRRAAITVEGHL